MRPVTHPAYPGEAATLPVGALLLAGLGEYCSLCERPLPLELWVLDVSTGEVYDADSVHDEPSRTLILCHDCVAAHEASGAPSLDAMLLPHRAPTFALGSETPFSYFRTTVARLVLPRQDEPEDRPRDPEPLDTVLVAAADPAAAATVEHFRLNTRYDVAPQTFVVPAGEMGVRYDRRAEQRAKAWEQAERCVGHLGGAAVRDADPLVADVVRDVAAATGFWSVFATVFWNAWGDSTVVERLLAPTVPGRLRQPLAEVASTGDGVARTRFPGTRDGWLPR